MEKINSGILEGIAKYNEGEYEAALSIFNSLLSGVGDDILAQFYKGNTLGALGNFTDAISCFDKILGKEPKNEKAKKAKEIFRNIEINSFSPKLGSSIICKSKELSPKMSSPNISKISISNNNEIKKDKKESKKEIYEDNFYPMAMPCESEGKDLKGDIQFNLDEIRCEVFGGNNTLYGFLKSNEAEDFFQKDELKNIEVTKIIDNFSTNDFDKEAIINLIKDKKSSELLEFIKKVKLRNSVLDYLADSSILPPRKYNTIIYQIQNINAEFALAFLMFNIGEKKYNEILIKLGEKPNIIKGTEMEIKNNGESEKLGILKVIANFFIRIFAFEKAFINENNKLKYFKYLFVFLGFLGVLTLVGYGINNNVFKADIKATRTTTASGTVESITEVRSQ